jgi:hypothetical protein
MFNKKSIIVVGAGASKEVALPTGEELKERIRTLLNIRFRDFQKVSGDDLVYEALRIEAHQAKSDITITFRRPIIFGMLCH